MCKIFDMLNTGIIQLKPELIPSYVRLSVYNIEAFKLYYIENTNKQTNKMINNFKK